MRLLPLLVLAACAARSSFLEPGDDLDRSLYFYEQDRRGSPHGISRDDAAVRGPDGTQPEVLRVGKPALVDIDSTLRLLVDKARLGAQARPTAVGGADLLARKQGIEEILAALEEVVNSRKRAVEAWKTRTGGGFAEPKKAYARERLKLVQAVRANFERNSVESRTIGKALTQDKTYAAARAWLEAELDRIAAGDATIASELERRRATLRIQAFLETGGKPAVPVHLEHYDRLAEGQLQTRDRWGLDLSEEDRQRLQEQIDATVRLADAAERVRTGETSLREGLREALGIASSDLAKLVDEAEELAKKFERARFEETARLAEAYAVHLRTEVAGLAERTLAEIEAFPMALQSELETESQPVVRILGLVTSAKALSERWAAVSRAELPQLLTETTDLAGRIRNEVENLPESLRTIATDTRAFVVARAGEILEETRNVLTGAAVESEPAQALFTEVQALRNDLRAAAEFAQRARDTVARVLGIGNVEPVEAAPEVPEVIDVDLDEVKDTHLDLRRVPARAGDRIRVVASLDRPGKEPLEAESSFELVRYGWYAELSPAVVLVRPDQAKGSNEFRFAPTLSWMHHYVPRPGDRVFARGLIETMQPAVGVHAAFVDFAEDTEVQVGLGATLSFWDDRLQFGVGYNLMSEDQDDGRIYYFIGSDLIGLLQAIGLGR